MATAPRRIEPPVFDPPLVELDGGGQRHSQAWTEHNQQIADLLNSLVVSSRAVTDGSEAAAGTVGEVLTASASSVALGSGAVTTVTTVTLTAGDWEVSGGVTFNISGAASSHYGVGLDNLSTEIIATIPTGTGIWRLVPMTVRRNVTASTPVNLVAVAFFASGGVTADGVISARRVR